MNRVKINFVVDAVIFILFITVIISGYAMHGGSEGKGRNHTDQERYLSRELNVTSPVFANTARSSTEGQGWNGENLWRGVHEALIPILMIMAIVHILLHWKWVKSRFRRE